ncbi:MAG: TonB family protein [Zoogloeaceae bacterium]|jgi:TonB family protein|nr:TonB family protein [Zoogloeaceae bacterium]
MDSFRHFSIWQALFFSALAHGIVFSATLPLLLEGGKGDLSGSGRLEARLRLDDNAAPDNAGERAAKPEALPSLIGEEEKKPRQLPPMRENAPANIGEAEKTVSRIARNLPPPEASSRLPETVPAATMNQDATAKAGTALPNSHLDITGEGGRNSGGGVDAREAGRSDADGSAFAEYRLALKRAMEDSRRYPPLARSRGVTGEVVVRLIWSPLLAVPRVELAVSSGSHLLDEEALALLTHAVRITPLPEALRRQSFEFPQPMRFSLE